MQLVERYVPVVFASCNWMERFRGMSLKLLVALDLPQTEVLFLIAIYLDYKRKNGFVFYIFNLKEQILKFTA